MSYQSIGSEKGDSDSLGKLKAINLPSLRGKTFLDVGCNAGYFCGFALGSGAARVVGIDQNQPVIEEARLRFPSAEFFCSSWNSLPDGEFDVVILLSALHYADDQAMLINNLMQKVAKNGVLVLEVGIAPGSEEAMVVTKRAIDTRSFPTMSKMYKILDSYSFRLIGISVQQAGDPNHRYVFHVRHRRNVVMSCLGESGIGKSELTHMLADKSNGSFKLLHIDDYIVEFASANGLIASVDLNCFYDKAKVINLAVIYSDICNSGFVERFADYISNLCGDFNTLLIEGAVPYGYRSIFLDRLSHALDVDVWNIVPYKLEPLPDQNCLAKISSYINGHVDSVILSERGLQIVGWGYDPSNDDIPVDGLKFIHGELVLDIDITNRCRRSDVVKSLNCKNEVIGFVAEVLLDEDVIKNIKKNMSVFPIVSLFVNGLFSNNIRPTVFEFKNF